MIISELRVYDFRQFKSVDGAPGLKITFHKGLNALIGENDSGKTAVIDALKLVLLTQSNEYIRPSDEDFYKPVGEDACSEFKIDCTISEFTQNEAKNFIEYLSFNKAENGIEYAPEINPGLGELNLLFIAAELLLLKDDTDGGLKLALIEELEAHLHPQAQLRLISYLQNEYNENDVQIIISTHSPILASKINLKNLILMKNGTGYDLAEGRTGLQKGDYLFLQRFLDSTKANLFFAKGIIMVEGDAENILIPVVADILGYPLEKYGISVVNVGSTAFLRYSGIMVRKGGGDIGIPVSVITDCDIKPMYNTNPATHNKEFNEKVDESVQAQKEKNRKYTIGSVHGFASPRWTLEYCIAMSCLSDDFHKAVHYGKKILNAREYISLTDAKIDDANRDVKTEAQTWNGFSSAEKAYNIYNLMLNSDGRSSLKAIVAQCLASLLRWKISIIPDGLTQEKMFDLDLYGFKTDEGKEAALKSAIENDPFLSYIVNAIKYAAGEAV